MTNSFSSLLRSPATTRALVLGAAYGVLARAVAESEWFGETVADAFIVMTLAFVVFVPVVIGFYTVGAATAPSIWYRLFAPWIPIGVLIVVAGLVGWEGSICIYMGSPVLLVMSSIGGLGARPTPARHALLIVPFVLSPLEQRMTPPVRLGETVTEIVIHAPPAVVWPLVASVDSITPAERRPALFTALGFPKPVSATLSHEGIGGVRVARFERGLAFTETVTTWAPGERLAFTIDASTDTTDGVIALDQHVAIGGPYFDVMTGAYELHPVDDGRATRLVLRSEHRTSTRFNVYAAWWVDRVMASIQTNIMEVHKARAERVQLR